MKVRLLLICLFTVILIESRAQKYVVLNGGSWADAATWGSSPGGPGGAGVPTATDDVYTNGLTVALGASATCRNLFVSYDAVGIAFGGSNPTLTVTGALVGWNGSSPSAPIVNVFSGNSRITFTAANLNGPLHQLDAGFLFNSEVIAYWSISSPIVQATFTLNADATIDADFLEELKFTQFIINGGSNTLNTGINLSGLQVTSALQINSGTFNCTVPVRALFSENSRVNSVTVTGTLITSSYVNASTFNVSTAGTFKTAYSEGTSGWWHSTASAPGGNVLGAIVFDSYSDQVVPAKTYGSLNLDGGSSTKTIAGAGTLAISKDFNILSAGIVVANPSASAINVGGNINTAATWAPSQLISFNGTGNTQSVGGTGAISFEGGIVINNTGGMVSLQKNIDVDNGITINNGTLNLNSRTLTLTSGNVNNSGIITSGSAGTFALTGSSSLLNNSGGTIQFGNLNIGSDGNLTASAALNISGNLSIASGGVFNANGGAITFNGSVAQSISGDFTRLSNSSLNDIIVNTTAPGKVNVTGNVDLEGTLSLINNGVFDADGSGSGKLTIVSSGLSTGGRISSLSTPNNFSGTVNMERYIDSPADWRYLSIPVKNADVSDLTDDITVTGFSGETCTANGTTIFDCSAASIFEFTSSTQSWTGLTGSTYANTPLSSLKGYSIWSYLTGNTTLDITGEIEKGNVTISNLSALNGAYSLVPNPYPSAIDWDAVTNTGFSNSVYLTTSQGNFATYTKGSGVGVNHPDGTWTGQIAMGQSFWIQSSGGSSSLTLTESAKVATYEFVREAAPRDYFKMQLKSSQSTDELAIIFRDDATLGNDPALDAVKRMNEGNFNFSSYINGETTEYAINAIPRIQCNETVKLKLSDVSPGQHTITFTDLDKLDLGYDLVLVDNYLSTENKISAGAEYSFEVTEELQTYGPDRFEIRINSPLVDVNRDLRLSSLQECNKDLIRLEINNAQSGIQYLFKSGDIALHQAVSGDGGVSYAFIPKTLLAFGLNSLTLVASSLDGCNAHIFYGAITVALHEIDEITSVTSGQNCGDGTVNLSVSGGSADGYYRWYESESAIEPIAGASAASFTTPSLPATTIYYVTAVNANGCESTLRVPVEAKIVNPVKPEITVEGHELTVNVKTGIQWYKDGAPIEGATSPAYSVRQTGEYSVSVAKDGCTTESDVFEFIVNGPESKHTIHGYSLSPNPTRDLLYVNGPSFTGATVFLYDTKGRKLQVQGAMVNENQMSFDLTGTKNGLYLVNIQSQQKLIQLKAIKK